jgi:hypothetical protein
MCVKESTEVSLSTFSIFLFLATACLKKLRMSFIIYLLTEKMQFTNVHTSRNIFTVLPFLVCLSYSRDVHRGAAAAGFFKELTRRGAAAAGFLKIHRGSGSIFFEDIVKVHEFDRI